MVIQLPTFKGYTIDERLRQFRKVDRNKPSIEFIEFSSKEGQKLLKEMKEQNIKTLISN
jgi:hypothetical protein